MFRMRAEIMPSREASLTQRRNDAKLERGFPSGLLGHQTASLDPAVRGFATLRLCVKTVLNSYGLPQSREAAEDLITDY